MKIDDYILGHWSNRYQAQSQPTKYSTVEILWEKIDGGYHSKNYYRCDGPENPYRERYHRAVPISDTEVHFQNYDLNWTRAGNCDMIFVYDGNAWHGQLGGSECTGVRGYRVVAEIHLYGGKLHSKDQGYNSEGEMMWGSELLYKFTRMGE